MDAMREEATCAVGRPLQAWRFAEVEWTSMQLATVCSKGRASPSHASDGPAAFLSPVVFCFSPR